MRKKDDTSHTGTTLSEFTSEYGEIDFSCNLEIMPILEVVDMISRNLWTGFLIVHKDEKKAQIYFDRGNIIACSLGVQQGLSALYCLLSWTRGKGIFCQLKKNVEPQFDGPTLPYLIEASRLSDEWARVRSQKPTKSEVPWAEIPVEKRFFLDAIARYHSLQEISEKLEIEGIYLYLLVREYAESGWLSLAAMKKEEERPVKDTAGEKVKVVASDAITVMVIDDSMIARKIIKKILHDDPGIAQVIECKSLKEGLEKIEESRPDVVALDVILPEMTGAAAISHIKYRADLPVLMLTTYSEEGMAITLECLYGEAVDFIGKPGTGEELKALEARGTLLAEKIKQAARFPCASLQKLKPLMSVSEIERKALPHNSAGGVVLLGGGMGGYPALLDILSHLKTTPSSAVVVVQYMSELFLNFLIESLRQYCYLPISRARVGQPLAENHIYIMAAPTFSTAVLEKNGKIFLKVEPNPYALDDVKSWQSFSTTMKTAAVNLRNRILALILPGIGAEIEGGVEAIQESNGEVRLVEEWIATCTSSMPWAFALQIARGHAVPFIEEFCQCRIKSY